MLKERLENVRRLRPLIHSITNYVTVNDCANALLACGASPIMSDDATEVEEITSLCAGLNINIGTLNTRTIPSMLLAGKKAKELCRPVVLDPVGAGASRLRTETALRILNEVEPDIIRGNVSEIKSLAGGRGSTKGVDADTAESITDESLEGMAEFAKGFAAKTGAVIVMTGATDIVADSKRVFTIKNGTPMMSLVTGTGCMLSAVTAAYAAANREDMTLAAVAAVCLMGLSGERAFEGLRGRGSASLRNGIIDNIYNISGDMLEEGARYGLR